MNQELAKVREVRQGLTELVEKLSKVFSTDEVIDELMVLRKYNMSFYAEEMRAMLKEVGVFKLDYLSEIQMVDSTLTQEQALTYGLIDSNGNYLLRGRYAIPIRDIGNQVTAIVGWYPDSRKYITTPTYGFNKDGQFFNIECYVKSMTGDFPKYVDETGKELENCEGLVYLVEGIFDTLSLRALGFPALGNMGLDMSLLKTEILTRFGKVIAIPDNDKAGRSTNRYLNRISGKAKKFVWLIKNDNVIVQLPKGVKDTDDFIQGYMCKDDLLKCQKANFKLNLKEED